MDSIEPIRSLRQRLKGDDLPSLVLLAVATIFVAVLFACAFTMTVNLEHPANGGPFAPHSDALGPWLDGGLARLFGLPPPNYLYRPTVGWFWGSLLAATGHIEAIPASFLIALLLVCLTLGVFSADRPLRGALVVLMLFIAARFELTWFMLNFDIDLAAMVFSFAGILLLLWCRGTPSSAALLAGCASLGVAAAIRGPFMLAGPVVIALRLLLFGRPRTVVILGCVVAFFAPLVGDMALQRYFGTINNGLGALFCVYSDPSHGWTPDCNRLFRERQHTGAEIFRHFIAFRLSSEGRQTLLDSLAWRSARDLRLIHSPAPFAFLLGVAALASGYRRKPSHVVTPFVKAALVVGTLGVIWWMAPSPGRSALYWIVIATATAASTRHWRALLCLVTYLAGMFFLALAGLIVHDRLAQTFAFTLVLGIAFLALEESSDAATQPASSYRARTYLASGTFAGLLFLYFGSFVVHGTLRETYRSEVWEHANSAVKIGDDPAIDRSLYYTSQRQLVYAHHDDLPVGATRRYRSITPGTSGNASMEKPNTFRD